MNIDKFLEQNIEGYLFHDVEKMLKIELGEKEKCGACGYPIMITILAGMELLGFLLGKDGFNDHNGKKYFNNYWNEYLCKYSSKYNVEGLCDLIYNLIRHGLAHGFMTKPNILIYKNPEQTIKLIDKERGLISIDVIEFFSDFKNSYYDFVLKNNEKDEMQKRLNNMIESYSQQATDFFKKVGIDVGNLERNSLS